MALGVGALAILAAYLATDSLGNDPSDGASAKVMTGSAIDPDCQSRDERGRPLTGDELVRAIGGRYTGR